MAIRFFAKSDTHREFSNFAPFGIDLDDAWWPTVENYYQAQKFTVPDLFTETDELLNGISLFPITVIRSPWPLEFDQRYTPYIIVIR